MTATDKQPLISESVKVTRIDIHLVGEEPDQHVVRVTHGISRMTTVCEVPTKLKLGLCSCDEVLAPGDRPARPSSWCLILPPLNHLEAGWEQFNKVVTGLLGLPGLINPTCAQYKIKACHQGQNGAVHNQHRRGLPPWNLRIPTALSPPFPSE
jgi:hypothetical protein